MTWGICSCTSAEHWNRRRSQKWNALHPSTRTRSVLISSTIATVGHHLRRSAKLFTSTRRQTTVKKTRWMVTHLMVILGHLLVISFIFPIVSWLVTNFILGSWLIIHDIIGSCLIIRVIFGIFFVFNINHKYYTWDLLFLYLILLDLDQSLVSK